MPEGMTMRGKTFFFDTVILVISGAMFLFDPTGNCLPKAYGQNKPTTIKGWNICKEKLESTVIKESIGTPRFEAKLLQVCGERPVTETKDSSTTASFKADLPFKIDCTELDPARQSLCNPYITATRDQVYPHFREITGTSLSKCYDAVYYKIIPASPRSGAGGMTSRNHITYDQRYSVDSDNRYDVHELLHSISQCNGALDDHVFHSSIMNAICARLGRNKPYTKEASLETMNRLIKAAEKAVGSDLHDKCRVILGEQINIAYFDRGEEAAQRLYRSTIAPHPASAPVKQLVNVWGKSASIKVQVLLETLKGEYKYSLNVPACGY
jgi:hypothetical protein